MAWTTPVTQTTNTHITAAVWNEQITDNMAYLGNTHNHDGGSGDGDPYALLPQGIILMADAACPTGWTRVAAFDGKFVRGAASYGGSGGAATHSHSHDHGGVNDHGHDQNYGARDQIVSGNVLVATAAANAVMSVTGGGGAAYRMIAGFQFTEAAIGNDATATADLPAYVDVIFCKKD